MTDDGGAARGLLLRAGSAASLALLPLLLAQGKRVRRDTPRLPEAGGPREGEVPGDGVPIRLLLIGESTAAGVGAPDHERGLAGSTARTLAQATGRGVRWRVIGRNGATAHAARTELLADAAGVEADVVVVALGVNDTLRFHRSSRWRADLAALVDAIRGRCGAVPVVLASVPPVGRFPALPQPLRGALGLRASLLGRAAARLARESDGVVYDALLPLPENEVAGFFCEDAFHPSVDGYAVWGRSLGEAAAKMLGR